jgi:hypothetical protein
MYFRGRGEPKEKGIGGEARGEIELERKGRDSETI